MNKKQLALICIIGDTLIALFCGLALKSWSLAGVMFALGLAPVLVLLSGATKEHKTATSSPTKETICVPTRNVFFGKATSINILPVEASDKTSRFLAILPLIPGLAIWGGLLWVFTDLLSTNGSYHLDWPVIGIAGLLGAAFLFVSYKQFRYRETLRLTSRGCFYERLGYFKTISWSEEWSNFAGIKKHHFLVRGKYGSPFWAVVLCHKENWKKNVLLVIRPHNDEQLQSILNKLTSILPITQLDDTEDTKLRRYLQAA